MDHLLFGIAHTRMGVRIEITEVTDGGRKLSAASITGLTAFAKSGAFCTWSTASAALSTEPQPIQILMIDSTAMIRAVIALSYDVNIVHSLRRGSSSDCFLTGAQLYNISAVFFSCSIIDIYIRSCDALALIPLKYNSTRSAMLNSTIANVIGLSFIDPINVRTVSAPSSTGPGFIFHPPTFFSLLDMSVSLQQS